MQNTNTYTNTNTKSGAYERSQGHDLAKVTSNTDKTTNMKYKYKHTDFIANTNSWPTCTVKVMTKTSLPRQFIEMKIEVKVQIKFKWKYNTQTKSQMQSEKYK